MSATPAWRTRLRALGGALLALAVVAPMCATPGLEIIDAVVSGDEVRVLLKTYRAETNWLVDKSYHADTKLWLLQVNLLQLDATASTATTSSGRDSPVPATPRATLLPASAPPPARSPLPTDGPPVQLPPVRAVTPRTRLIGPWDAQVRLRESRGHPGYFANTRVKGSVFPVPAGFAFDPDGSLVRVWRERETPASWRREKLDLALDRPEWGRGEAFLGPDTRDSINATFFGELVRRYSVRRTPDGPVTLHETTTGRRLTQAWVEPALSLLQALPPNTGNLLTITEDEKFLVVDQDARPRVRTDLVLAGKTYDRTAHGIYFVEGDAQPHVFERRQTDAPNARSSSEPVFAVSIAGRLHLLSESPGRMRLAPVDGTKAFEATVPWGYGRWRHDSAQERLLWVERGAVKIIGRSFPFMLREWSYRSGAVIERNLDIMEWFEEGAGAYHPRTPPTAPRE